MFMRGVVLCILMALAPFASAISLPPDVVEEIDGVKWSEVVITSHSKAWDLAMWDDVKNAGGHPIRTLNNHELLVWQKSDLNLSSQFSAVQSKDAVWKSDVEFGYGDYDEIKILFEPRLPIKAYSQIQNDLDLVGINAPELSSLPYSVMPHKITVGLPDSVHFDAISKIPGILWVEPVLSAEGRNLVASAYLSDGDVTTQPHWDFGLNGEGVVLGIADSGLDVDHSCFRNGSDSIGEFGSSHRKVLVSNISLDDGDNPGEIDYRHGTHVAGSLVCHDVYNFLNDEKPLNGTTMSYGAQLVFQDIVSNEGWIPPENITELLLENSLAGGVIHSNSWGDDTTAYTDRTADFDLWAIEVPWSLSFIAPGNTGGQLLEPSNGRNVVAIGASTKATTPEIWQSSSVGPTELGTFGIFAIAPGVSINSAKADGFDESMNNALRSSSGTSMATPIAASFGGIIQQMVEQGWILSSNEATTEYNLSDIKPSWSSLPNETINLGNGFTPSGLLLKSLLVLATQDIVENEQYFLRNNDSGWGALDLSKLIDFENLEASLGEENLTPATNIWIHDSYRNSFDVAEWLMQRFNSSNTSNIEDSPWSGVGAEGPFLQSGESWTKRLVPNLNEDLEIVMSFPAKPEPFIVDDLRLVVTLSNGYVATGQVYDPDGYSSLFNNESFNDTQFQASNETSVAVKISKLDLADVEWIDVEIHANYISPGNSPGGVGVDGDRTGFALAAKGVIRDSINWEDSDGDGLPNAVDLCPNQNPHLYDSNMDGCPDDSDNDGVIDQYDLCPSINAQGFDNDLNGCIDDSDNDGVGDDIDACETEVIDINYPVGLQGCRPIDSPIMIVETEIIGLENNIWASTLEVRWEIADADFDPYLTGSRIMINQSDNYSFFPIVTCTAEDIEIIDNTHICIWNAGEDLPIFDVTGYGMHVQFFAQSLNASPEGDNEIIYLDSELYFSSNRGINIEIIQDKDSHGSASVIRSIGWGIITILSIALICRKLWSVIQEDGGEIENKQFFAANPFVDVENE